MARIAAFQFFEEDRSKFADFEDAQYITRFDVVFAFDPDEVSDDGTVYCTKVRAYAEFNEAFDALPVREQNGVYETVIMTADDIDFLSRPMKREDVFRMAWEQEAPCLTVESFDDGLIEWLKDCPL